MFFERCEYKATSMATMISKCDEFGTCNYFVDNESFNKIYNDCLLQEVKYNSIEIIIFIMILLINLKICC